MKNTTVRLVLALLALAAIGGAGYYVFTLEQRAAAVREADRAFAEDVLRLQATLADLRGSQAAYLATGQDTAVWIEKVLQLRQQADAQVRKLLASATPPAESELAAVAEAVASFGRFDARVIEVLRDEQPLTASGLIFGDAAQVLAAAGRDLSAVRGQRTSRAGAELGQLRRQELYAAAGAAAVAVLALLLLVPVSRSAETTETTESDIHAAEELDVPGERPAVPVVSASEGTRFDFDLELPPRRRAAERTEAAADPPREETAALLPTPGAVPAAPPAVLPGVDLGAAARLCTDLARVRETSELQGLLARAAGLLDATGIVVWMGSSEGEVLWPAFSHGYSPQTLARMQALPRDGATPVSVAFRKGLMEVIPAGEGNSGAIVAPILTAAGCVGVMAVEVREAAATSESAQAMSSILAAQLATLVASA